MAVAANFIINRVKDLLNDANLVHWTEAELLRYLSDAQRFCVQVRPESNVITAIVPVVQGVRQTIPESGFILFDVIRNMGADGNHVPGRTVKPISRNDLDQIDPEWATVADAEDAVNFMYDVNNREVYYVSPPLVAGRCLEIAYAAVPAEIAAAGDSISMSDAYIPCLVEFVLYRARSKDISVEGQGVQTAARHLQNCTLMLTGNAEEVESDTRFREEKMEGEGMRRR